MKTPPSENVNSKRLKKVQILYSPLLIFLLAWASCKNDVREVNQLFVENDAPAESAKKIEMTFSTNGLIDMVVKAPVLNRFDNDKGPYTELPEGVLVYFYDSLQHVKSSLTSKYAINYEHKNMMEAKNDVVVVNEAGERLNTEHLIWDEKEKKIYSDAFVTITTNDEILHGHGFESDETFGKWVIKKPVGEFNLKEDE